MTYRKWVGALVDSGDGEHEVDETSQIPMVQAPGGINPHVPAEDSSLSLS